MSTQIVTSKTEDSFSIRCEYSPRVVSRFRSIAGHWDSPFWTWKNGSIANAEKLCGELFGVSDEIVKIQVYAKDCDELDNFLLLGGYVVANRRYRDSNVFCGEFCDLISGSFSSSGGSVKNPRVNAADDLLFEIAVRKDFAEANGFLTPEKTSREIMIETIKAMMQTFSITLDELQ